MHARSGFESQEIGEWSNLTVTHYWQDKKHHKDATLVSGLYGRGAVTEWFTCWFLDL